MNKKQQEISFSCIVSRFLSGMKNAWASCLVLSLSCFTFNKLISWHVCCCSSCCRDLSHCRSCWFSRCREGLRCNHWDRKLLEMRRAVIWDRKLLDSRSRAVIWDRKLLDSRSMAVIWDRKLLDSRSRVVIRDWDRRSLESETVTCC